MNPNEITAEDLKKKMDSKEDFILLDVREQNEHNFCKIGEGPLIPVNSIPLRYQELDKEKEIVVYCRTGGRSGWATNFLLSAGFTNVKNLIGGIYTWSDRIDASVKKY